VIKSVSTLTSCKCLYVLTQQKWLTNRISKDPFNYYFFSSEHNIVMVLHSTLEYFFTLVCEDFQAVVISMFNKYGVWCCGYIWSGRIVFERIKIYTHQSKMAREKEKQLKNTMWHHHKIDVIFFIFFFVFKSTGNMPGIEKDTIIKI
jgi:hypothetical protein